MGNTIWRAAPISVEKLLDELRVGVERLIRCEGFTAYQVLTNSECVPVRVRE